MLLAFCFRDPSKKKHKKIKNWKDEKKVNNEQTYVLSETLLSSQKGPQTINKTKKQTNRSNFLVQKRHLSPEKQLRLKKDKEELKVQRKSYAEKCGHDKNEQSSSLFTQVYARETRPRDLTKILLSQSQAITRDISRMFASAEDLEESLLSTPSTPSLSNSAPAINDEIVTFAVENHTCLSGDETKLILMNENAEEGDSKYWSKEDAEKLKQRKVGGNQANQNHVEREEIVKKTEEETERIIENLKLRHQIELQKVKEVYDAKTMKEKEHHLKSVERANIDIKNEANETISKLNMQIIQERGEMFAHQQDNSKLFDERLQLKKEQLNQTLKNIEKRQFMWQEEKSDVLNEVQRLKYESTRMAKNLAMGCGVENLLDNQKSSLSQEVQSLQLVVEMRTGEMRNLREQLARATQQLELVEIGKERLRKATSRMEDLEEQLSIKTQRERHLAIEKSQLETQMTNTNNEAKRLSKNMEALQWRVRNNFCLPVENISSGALVQTTGLPAKNKSEAKYITKCTQSTTEADKKQECIKSTSGINNKAIFQIDGDAKEVDIVNKPIKLHNKSEYSEPKENGDYLKNIVDVDEGLGDISSDGDHQIKYCSYDNTGDLVKLEDLLPESDIVTKKDKIKNNACPERERVASMF